MNLPWRCQHCGRDNWIDLEKLASRPKDKIISVEGFTCTFCSGWTDVFFTSHTMRDAMQTLEFHSARHPKFYFLFLRALRKAYSTRAHMEKP